MNLYTTLSSVKSDLGIDATDTTYDAIIAGMIEAASRQIDRHCDRQFYVVSGTRYFTPRSQNGARHGAFIFGPAECTVDDLLAIDSLSTDVNLDGTYAETWATDDYWLRPDNEWPKTQIIPTPWGDYGFPTVTRGVRITGQFGFGDGYRATPYDSIGATVTSDASSATVTVSVNGAALVGDTLLVGSEQMYVSAVASQTGHDSLTVKRAVNGTTAAATGTGGASAYVYRYPADVVRLAKTLAAEMFKTRDTMGLQMEQIGSYIYQKSAATAMETLEKRVLEPLVRYK